MAGTHFTFLRDQAASFEDMAALDTYGETGARPGEGRRGHRLRVLRVTSGYFTTLASSPQQGQGFDRADESGTRRIVLSEATWRTRFGSDPAVIGRTIQLSGQPFEVVGIAAAWLRGSDRQAAWMRGFPTVWPGTPTRRTTR